MRSWIVIAFALLVILVVVSIAIATMRTPKIDVARDGLRIRGNAYGRTIPLAHLRLDAARVVDFNASPELRPKRRTNGASLPGRHAGWFRLQNGEKALVFLTGEGRAAYIPTTEGYSVLIAPQGDALLDALRAQPR
jgi:hypothetical protein